MSNSNHPYRQVSNTPYPIQEFAKSGRQSSDAIKEVSNGMEDLHLPPNQNKKLYNTNNNTHNNTNNITSSQGNVINQSLQHLPPHLIPHSSTSSPRFSNQRSPVNSQFSPTIKNEVPYPMYESQTPPPVFASKESVVVSPPSNPLSTNSSVTNLNIDNNANPTFSKSENNLSATSFNKFGHNRSVSSTSSFFYDRNDNSSMIDFNQNVIQSYLGSNSSHLMPRIKTLELYRKNAKKSNDPNVLFQYAQYMLQTALLVGMEQQQTSTSSQSSGSQNGTPFLRSIENSPRKGPVEIKHKKNKSFDFSNIELEGNEKNLKKALLKEAVHYLKRLSDKGYVEAQYLLGDAYSSGALEKIDNKDAFILFQSAAKHGHVESAYRTSYCYEEGLGTGRDARKAVEYLKIAAAKNHPAAMYKLGVYSFYSRMGLPNDMNTKKMGIKWLTRATNVATELTAAAPFELGKLYFNGFVDIVLQDKTYGLELFSQAAALGHIESSFILGKAYEEGTLIQQDANLSVHYYTQAALGGDPNAMLGLVGWYLIGSDPFLTRDEKEAFEWAKRAAMCNLPKAQFALANFYEKGIGCDKDLKEAQVWYIKAAESGDEKSISRVSDKELIKKIQKELKKKPSSPDSSTASEKECIIM